MMFNIIMHKILCFFGIHDFEDMPPLVRECKQCHLMQRLEFYSNRTQEWVDMEDWED